MFGVANEHRLDPAARDEFKKLDARLGAFLKAEHNPDGTHNIGEWQDYDVRWATTGAGTAQPSLGNGRLGGRYRRVANTVDLRIELVLGSTTTVGSSAWTFSLPATPAFPPVSASWPVLVGSAYSTWGSGQVLIGYTAGGPMVQIVTVPGAFFQLNHPGIWAADSMVSVIGSYEAAEE